MVIINEKYYGILEKSHQDRPPAQLFKEQMLKTREGAQRMKHIPVLYPSY